MTRFPPRAYRVFKIKHRPTGMYALSVNKSKEYSVFSFLERINDMATWGPDRKFINLPLMFFAKTQSPVRSEDFVVSVVSREFRDKSSATEFASLFAIEAGTDKLLSSQIVPVEAWELYKIAFDHFGSPKVLEERDALKPPNYLETVTRSKLTTEYDIRVSSESSTGGDLTVWQLLAGNIHITNPVCLTVDRETALRLCNAMKRHTVVVIRVGLMPKNGARVDDFEYYNFIHFGVYLEETLAEATKLVNHVVSLHTPNTKYVCYE